MANTRNNRSTYVSGNTARVLDVRRAIEEAPRPQLSATARKNREKAIGMNLGYVMFLSVALLIAGLILVQYIRLQSDITNTMGSITSLESEYNSLKDQNDEAYNRITSSVDLAEVKRVAMEELGMTYAQEGQIVTYASDNSDYVRQYSLIP